MPPRTPDQWQALYFLMALRGHGEFINYVQNWQERVDLGRPLTDHMKKWIEEWSGQSS